MYLEIINFRTVGLQKVAERKLSVRDSELDELVGEHVRTFTCLKLTTCRARRELYQATCIKNETALFHFIYIYISSSPGNYWS